VYAYFAHILHDANQGEAHYQKVTQQWPRNHLAWAFYATFLAEIKGNWKEAEASFRQAISCVEQNERDQVSLLEPYYLLISSFLYIDANEQWEYVPLGHKQR